MVGYGKDVIDERGENARHWVLEVMMHADKFCIDRQAPEIRDSVRKWALIYESKEILQ